MRHLAVMLAIAALVQLSLPIIQPSTSCAGTVYNFELVAGGAVIAPNSEPGDPANPSVIRVPEWIPSNQRPSASANYYMYYGSHTDDYIRMRWAETLDGPWSTFNLGGTYNGHDRRGVFDTDSDPTRDNYDHVFAPDVHVDNVNQRIIMYYHGKNQGPSYDLPSGTRIWRRHDNFVATSQYGLNFNDPVEAGGETGHGPVSHTTEGVTREVIIGPDYQHVFEYKGGFYSVSKRGTLQKAPNPADPWAPHPTLPYKEAAWIEEDTPSALWTNDANPNGQEDYTSPAATFLASSQFANHPNNPHPGKNIFSEDADDGLRMNHGTVNLLEAREQLEVFFYVRADGATDYFDDTYRIVYDISDPDFQNWTVAVDDATGEYMFDVVVTDDEIRAAVQAANPGADPDDYADPSSMGAPAIFVDDDGSKYLFFTYYSAANGGNPNASEGQISAVKLISLIVPGDANGDNAVNDEDLTLFQAQFGQSGASSSADFDLDGDVDLDDFAILRRNFGRLPAAPPADASEPLPEPATITVLAIGGLLALSRRLEFRGHLTGLTEDAPGAGSRSRLTATVK
jgi:hypothetical protein